MPDDFTFKRHGRSPKAAIALGATYSGLLTVWWFLDAAPWIVGGLALFTLPALWEFVTNPAAGMRLSDNALTWHTGRHKGHLPLRDINFMRLDTRLDFSVRASAVQYSGKHIRLPDECLPDHRLLEQQLILRTIRVERHHFTLFQNPHTQK